MIDFTDLDFNIEEFGSFYSKHKTAFKVFAPESKSMYLMLNGKKYPMNKKGFSYEIMVEGDFELAKYYFINDKNTAFKDPFSYFSDKEYSYVLDTTKFIRKTVLPEKQDNIIIYETSVRDFSCDDKFKSKDKRKLLALIEPGLSIEGCSVGLDYLKELGITHLQLMPIFDFDLARSEYNWGYNPLAYNYLYNAYISDDKNPYANINELRKVVNILHDNNIRITLDVVFNHAYRIDEFDLHKMIPGHVFRMTENGKYAKGSLCGNEIKTEDPFVRAYLVSMVKRYIRLYDIDGIRIDQMGIGDYDTVDLIYKEANKIKDGFIVYGEGWNMGDALPVRKRAAIINAGKIRDIGMFNDYFRDTIINYVCGDNNREDVKNALFCRNNNLIINQSLNYVECHDNFTFYDRLIKYNTTISSEELINKCKLALGMVVLARGIPFIHSGEEFLRTKNKIANSYNKPESINKIDWKRRVEYNDVCLYLKELIKFRKNNPIFINPRTKVSFSDFEECIIYKLDDIKIFINASNKTYTYSFNEEHEILLDFNAKKHYFTNNILINANSLVIVK